VSSNPIEEEEYSIKCRDASRLITRLFTHEQASLAVSYSMFCVTLTNSLLDPDCREKFKRDLSFIIDEMDDKVYEDCEDFDSDTNEIFEKIWNKKY
jgi:hypothetical protein